MNHIIDKQNFIDLCNLLEKGIITLEQFHALGNIKNTDNFMLFQQLVEREDFHTKEELINKVIETESTAWIRSVYQLFEKYSIYRIDPERTKFLLENFKKINSSFFELFTKDEIYYNEELLKILLKFNTLSIPSQSAIIEELLNLYEKCPEVFKDAHTLDVLSKSLLLEKVHNITEFISCLEIKSLRREPKWFDKLFIYYLQYSSIYNHSAKITPIFQKMEEINKMDSLTEKMKNLDNTDLEYETKEEYFINFFRNIRLLNENLLTVSTSPEYIDYLLNHLTQFDRYQFTRVMDFIYKSISEVYSVEDTLDICDKIVQIPVDTIRQITIDAILNHVIEKEEIGKFIEMNFDEVKIYIIRSAMEKNNQEYLEKGMEYYKVGFSDSFCSYIDSSSLTKEEILDLRNKVLAAPVCFQDQKFIVDVDNFLPELEIRQEKEEVQEEKIKKKHLGIFEKFFKQSHEE